ncbi:hypothetical protein J3458_009352 [Metarhizium acridum]|uniref:uncharacterized protein n=1 Tax=Metarhizium acridum TaxID=92637 RepID=UPI001C6D0708|nr:hypothetical protein J3458_009352 [Metarhizium acridum]
MATRTRGRRRNNPLPEIVGSPEQQMTPRTTRRTIATVKDTIAVVGYGSLSKDPIPRRGAHQPNDAASIASLSSRRKTRSEIAEDEDEDEEFESSQPQPEGDSLQEDSLSVDDVEQYQIMASLLPDFTSATEELQHRLVNGDYKNKVFAAILNSKRITFHSLLENYLKSKNESSFIDLPWVEELSEGAEGDGRVLDASSRANIVTALDGIQRLKDNTISDILPFLKDLDSAFMHLFNSEDSTEDDWKLALDLRTCYFIEALAAQGAQPDVMQTVASVFCKDTNSKDYAHLFVHGPFKNLTRKHDTETSDDEDELISKRATELYTIAVQNKKDHGLGRLRESWPLDRTLKELSQCLVQWYVNSKDAARGEKAELNEQTEPGRESWHDAEETIPDSFTESQPIIRPTGEEQKRASLFQGAKSLRDLPSGSNRKQAVPPSNQQQHNKTSSPVPSDYPQDETRDLLRNDVIRGPRRAQKRRRNNDEGEDDDDDEEFEDDTRGVPESRVSRIKARAAAQAAKRQSLPTNPPSRSMPPPPRPTSSLPPSTDEPDYETIKQLKSEAIARARARALDSAQHLPSSAPPPPSSSTTNTTTTHAIETPPKQRYAWSNRDCNLLLKLIKERHAAWAAIEREHNHEFEHPRNQQAYRDKARNMKVDLLITDAILPSGFDLVTLGKKEIARLLSLGKNPYRREDDKENGKALNTNI